MGIKIIKEPDVHVTEGELARYREEYQKAFSHYCGPRPTLEEFIRGKQGGRTKANRSTRSSR